MCRRFDSQLARGSGGYGKSILVLESPHEKPFQVPGTTVDRRFLFRQSRRKHVAIYSKSYKVFKTAWMGLPGSLAYCVVL